LSTQRKAAFRVDRHRLLDHGAVEPVGKVQGPAAGKSFDCPAGEVEAMGSDDFCTDETIADVPAAVADIGEQEMLQQARNGGRV
jgi:hypothetical protein